MNLKLMWNYLDDTFGQTIIHPQYFSKVADYQSLKEVKRHPKGTFLDIGCGRQWYRKDLEDLFINYYAQDHPKISKLYLSSYPVELKSNATNIPLPEKSVNLALMIRVFEHLPDPEKALKEIKRILKPKGVLIICTVENYPGHDFPYNYYHWTKFGLKETLKRNNFQIKKLQSFGNFWETQVVFQNVYLMHFVKKFPPLLLLFGPIMILANIAALVLGRRKVTENYALAHLLVAQHEQS